ncbi:GntR family transcriptional regulator [Actinomadura flavalba]|uniref:GntR family transcriptional regulator n=1 Tax=Actinomadura flavalba TaxID=1120938 RepID=UPI00036A7ABD|nr:GntR family transcriptional regulator [Actinomadura flavalba]
MTRKNTAAAETLSLTDATRLRADRARQVADVLRRRVRGGDFTDGVLPAEGDLVAAFGTSRNTVRDALDLLRAEGIIERCPGVGTTVVARAYPHGLERLQGLAETLREHGEVVNEVRAAGRIVPPREISARLELAAGEPVVYVERLRRLNGLPLSLDLTYLAPDVGEPLLAEDLAGTDVFVLLERITGQPLGRAEVTLEAVNADPHSAAVLDAPRGAALLMLERLTHLADGRPVDLEYIRFRGDRIAMSGLLHRF